LAEVIDRFADFKIVTIHCDDPRGRGPSELTKYAKSENGELVKLKIKRDRATGLQGTTDELPVNDIDIEEVPIEEVIRQIFAR
jgi:ABC-type uncharacterized transport system ATPase subunit